MGHDRRKDEEAIFYCALELASPTARAAYLKEACGDDRDLLERVRALLKVDGIEDGFLENPPTVLDVPTPNQVLTEGPGSIIGRYKLLERIGEGGMAVVYMAEQTEPIRRKVALKIIKLGMDTRQVIARFEAERQALALMDHPNIAKVLDAGATETGRPYFVMELVQGVSITEYCDKNNLSTKDRLALFLQVCNAVQHAHQKGIIHRDIKPSNVMVTHHDGKPVPKVIDFGIAKATSQRLTEKTLFTRYAHIIGTPAYMSPEQAELSDLDIDTRSDIYSLGVLLYELLTGTTPFSEEELRKAGYIEMQRIIREQEPAKPSTKLSTLGETASDIAKCRSSTPDLLRKAVRGDLDWIVMKSLEKDRARRYETPNSLASDILRHLEHEPVLARGPSTTYRLQKLLRRHRSQAIAGLATALVVGGAVIVLSMWNRDRLQLAEAEGFRHRGILSQAREQYARADREAALETIKPILHSRHVGAEAQLLQAGILVDNRRSEEAAVMLGDLLNDRPEIAGAAHALLARILWESESPNAEKLKEIEEHHRQAEALLPETAEAYFLRAMTAITVKEQLASLDKALQLDPSHYESRRLRAFTYYASRKYDRLRDDALAMTILRPRDPLGHSLRAVSFRELGKYDEAIAEYDRAIALTPEEDPQYTELSSQRCEVFLRMGDYERVIAEARESLKLSPDKPVFQYYSFCALTALGEYDKATTLFGQIISPGQEARTQLGEWCTKYVFDACEAGRSWHPPDRESAGAAFLPMVEAEEIYRALRTRARRVTTDGFSAQWSPDGSRLAFSMGAHGTSGVGIFDSVTKETELLIVPGRDPRWSPDGRYLAFVRDRQVLRVPEFAAAERRYQAQPFTDEEVWLMKSDGTEPRRLARGGWPSWSKDSSHVYYHSRLDLVLCSISIMPPDIEAQQIMPCPPYHPAISPDNQRVAYVEGTSLIVKDLASQALTAKWPVPPAIWNRPAWSAAGNELCMGTAGVDDTTGLWIYRLDRSEPLRTLPGPITLSSWAMDGTKLVFDLGPPYYEVWTADLDPAVSAVEALGPSQTLEEYFREMVAFYTRRIETDPENAGNYLYHAAQYQHLRDQENVRADMRQYRAVLSGLETPTAHGDFVFGTPENMGPAINSSGAELTPHLSADGLEFYFDRGGKESGIYVARRATLDGEWEPASEIPNLTWYHHPFLTPDGLTLFLTRERERPGTFASWDLWVTTRATKDDNWGTPVNLGATVNSSSDDGGPSLSADGLELYFSSNRPGGYGGYDLWMTTRATVNDDWGTPVNLGPPLNTSAHEAFQSTSRDGLVFFFCSTRSGGSGGWDLYMARRATTKDPWGSPTNLGPTVNSAASDQWVRVSADGSILYFSSSRAGGLGTVDIWQVPILRVVDFDGDGKVKEKED